MKDALLDDINQIKPDFGTTSIKIPKKFRESEADGMFWAAGFVAFKMKHIQNLGAYQHNAKKNHAKNTITSHMNCGGLNFV